MISLDEYVQNMKADQKDIYYIAADSVTSAKNTPFLEKLLEKDLEACAGLLNYSGWLLFVLIFFSIFFYLKKCFTIFDAGAILS